MASSKKALNGFIKTLSDPCGIFSLHFQKCVFQMPFGNVQFLRHTSQTVNLSIHRQHHCMQRRLDFLQALDKMHSFDRRGKSIFAFFFQIKHCLFCPFHKLSFECPYLKTEHFHLMFCFLDSVHRKEFDLAFLHHAQLLLHLSQFL